MSPCTASGRLVTLIHQIAQHLEYTGDVMTVEALTVSFFETIDIGI